MSILVQFLRKSKGRIAATVAAVLLLLTVAVPGSIASAMAPDETTEVSVVETTELEFTSTVPTSEDEETSMSLIPEETDIPSTNSTTESVEVSEPELTSEVEETEVVEQTTSVVATTQPVTSEETSTEVTTTSESSETTTTEQPPAATYSTSTSVDCQGFTAASLTIDGELPPDAGAFIAGFTDSSESTVLAYEQTVEGNQTLSISFPQGVGAIRFQVGEGGEYFTQRAVYETPRECNPPVDSDGDGVPDDQDKCPGTPSGVAVDANGCPVTQPPADSDGDGVNDDVDKCPGTPAGTPVDANGCPVVTPPVDSDGDGVPDDQDRCPGTQPGFTVDANGCIVCPEGTQPIYAEGNDGIVNDCRPIETTQPTVPTTTSSDPTTSVSVPTETSTPTTTSGGSTVTSQPTSSSNPSTSSNGTTSSQAPSNSGEPSTQSTSVNTGPIVVAVPGTPAINDPAGSANATWIKPSDGDSRIIWTLSDGDRRIVASLPEGYVFADGSTHIDFGIACDSEGEQVVVHSTSAGNPTPQPTANGGEGVRASSTNGELIRAIGVIGLLVGSVVFVMTARRRKAGQHQ